MKYIILGILFALLVSCAQPSEDFTEFDFDELPVEELPVVLHAEPEETPTLSEKELHACAKDADCALVQPDACCACPAAINKHVDYPTLALGNEPTCKETVPCGVCVEYTALEAKCISSVCTATKKKISAPIVPEEPVQEEVAEPKTDIKFYPIPELDSSANFAELTLKPACFREYNAVYFRYSMKQPAITRFQVREESQEEYTSIFTEDQNFFQTEVTLVICPTCIINNYGILRTDKKYFMRIESDFDGDVTYTPDYIIDTRMNSEYTSKQCLK